jgi:hypothetical protein
MREYVLGKSSRGVPGRGLFRNRLPTRFPST